MKIQDLRLISTCVIYLIMMTSLFGQGTTTGGLIRLIDPQPPNVAELGKYIMYPTVEYTGVLPVSIPLFEISLKGKTLPFQLNYHASGIKVNQEETEVGLGWSLSGIYTISRTVIGGLDERQGSNMTYSGVYFRNPKTIQELMNEYFVPIVPRDQVIISTKKNELRALALGNNDNHSDLYTFSTKSRSGKFLVKNMNEYYTIPFSSVKISRGIISTDSYRSYPFTIVDDEGMSYLFDERSYAVGDEFNSGMTGYLTTNSWYVSKITDNESGEFANFQYESNWIREYINFEQQKIGYEFNGAGVSDISYSHINSTNFVDNNNKLITSILHSNGQVLFEYISVSKPSYFHLRKFLNKIKVLDHKGTLVKEINFAYDSSTDRVKLSSVTVRNLEGTNNDQKYDFTYNSLRLPPKGSFSVDYWGYHNGYFGNTYLPPTTIRAKGVVSYSGPPPIYTFGSADRIPNLQYTQGEMLKRITYPTRGYTEFEFESNKYLGKVSTTSYNEINETVVGLGVDQKNEVIRTFTYGTVGSGASLKQAKIYITFNPPTPPYTEFSMHPQWVRLVDKTTNTQVFEKWHDSDPSQPLNFVQDLNLIAGNNYELRITVYGASVPQSTYITTNTSVKVNWNTVTESDGEKLGGGLRVKSVKNYSPEGNLLSHEYYKYGENENGLGVSFFDESIFYKNYHDQDYYTFYETGGSSGTAVIPQRADWWDRKYFGISSYSSVGASGATIGYTKVSKYQQDVVKADLILSESEYSLSRDVSFSSYDFLNSQNYGSLSFLISEPELIKRTYFRKYGNTFMPIKKENYTYTHNYLLYTSPLVFETKYHEWTMGLTKGTSFLSDYYMEYDYKQSSFQTSRRKPLQKLIKDYYYSADLLQKDSVLTEQNLEYDAVYADEPSKIRITTSNNTLESIQEFTYPDDISTFTGFGLTLTSDEQFGLNSWKKNGLHLPNRPVRVKNYKGNLLKDSKYNLAKSFNGKVYASRSIEQRNSEVVSDFVVNLYDSYGNPLSMKKAENPVTTYLWGYRGQYPIAEIKNATYAEVLTVLSPAEIDALNNPVHTETVMETLIKNAVTKLRNHANLSKAMITSYTYRPLVGMTSKTDARGVTEYYEYDGMQRLKAVLDQVKNVTSSMNYHYRPN